MSLTRVSAFSLSIRSWISLRGRGQTGAAVIALLANRVEAP